MAGGGQGPNQHSWADRLAGWGYGSLLVDSLRPRGIASVCAPDRQPLVTRFDRAGDVIAAARWLQAQPGVDAKRIAVLGESHGGGTAATVVNEPFVRQSGGLIKASVDYYGPCRQPGLYGGIPLLALAGDDDTWGYPARTCTTYGAALPAGAPFQIATYPGVVHGFDNPLAQQRRFVEGHPLQYDADAASDSYARVRAFLDRFNRAGWVAASPGRPTGAKSWPRPRRPRSTRPPSTPAPGLGWRRCRSTTPPAPRLWIARPGATSPRCHWRRRCARAGREDMIAFRFGDWKKPNPAPHTIIRQTMAMLSGCAGKVAISTSPTHSTVRPTPPRMAGG